MKIEQFAPTVVELEYVVCKTVAFFLGLIVLIRIKRKIAETLYLFPFHWKPIS